MSLMLNDILHLSPEEISNSKIELNMDIGRGGQSSLDIWLKHSDEKKENGTCEDCSYWGWYGKQRNYKLGEWAFSFARISADEWLFISVVKITDIPVNDWAKGDVLDRFKPLFGRLIIKCKKSNKFARYVFKLSNIWKLENIQSYFKGMYVYKLLIL